MPRGPGAGEISSPDHACHALTVPVSARSRTRPLDELDHKLLGILQENASLSVNEMAERVGLSPTPCWRRIQKLEQAGIITGRVALLDPAKVGADLTVFVAIEAGDHSPEWLERFAGAVAAMPEVMELHRMAGDVDYLLRVAVHNMAAFDRFYKRLIAAIPLKNVTSRFAMERIKATTALPLHPSLFRDRRAPDDAVEG